jgi:hypothetical protein
MTSDSLSMLLGFWTSLVVVLKAKANVHLYDPNKRFSDDTDLVGTAAEIV